MIIYWLVCIVVLYFICVHFEVIFIIRFEQRSKSVCCRAILKTNSFALSQQDFELHFEDFCINITNLITAVTRATAKEAARDVLKRVNSCSVQVSGQTLNTYKADSLLLGSYKGCFGLLDRT